MRDTAEGGVSSRLTRWIMRLQEYRFDVTHKPGALHADADAISRLVGAATPIPKTSPSPYQLEVDKFMATGPTPEGFDAFCAARRSKVVLAAASAPLDVMKKHLTTNAPDLATLREIAYSDDEYCDLLHYLTTNELPEDVARATLIKRKSRDLHLSDGLLVRKVNRKGERRELLFIPQELRQGYLTAFHDRAGHPGRERTYMDLRSQAYWPGMWEDITDHINSCHECAFTKRSSRPEGKGHVPTIGDCPFDSVYVDVLTMSDKPTKNGNRKVLIFIDTLTRWVEAVALPGEPTSEEVLHWFCELVLVRHGIPVSVNSDSGSNLSSHLCASFYDHFEITLKQGTADHHQSQGLVERFNDTLTGMMRASVLDGTEWDDHLKLLLFTYRATPHRITGHSPAYLMYGRELRRPSPTALSQPVDPGNMTPEQIKVADRLVSGLRLAWNASHAATTSAQTADRDRADCLHDHAISFLPNERVLIRREGLLNKLAPRYEGPYRIAEVLPDGNYKLRDLTTRRRRETIHVSRLRPYMTVTDEERLAPDEYLIDKLVERRDRRLDDGTYTAEYKVKWRGYPKAEATWTREEDLMAREAVRDMIRQFNENHPPAQLPAPSSSSAPIDVDAAEGPSLEVPIAPGETEATLPTLAGLPAAQPDPDFPIAAKLSKGRWHYQVLLGTHGLHGPRSRWYPETKFTDAELQSFAHLRAEDPAAAVSEFSMDAFMPRSPGLTPPLTPIAAVVPPSRSFEAPIVGVVSKRPERARSRLTRGLRDSHARRPHRSHPRSGRRVGCHSTEPPPSHYGRGASRESPLRPVAKLVVRSQGEILFGRRCRTNEGYDLLGGQADPIEGGSKWETPAAALVREVLEEVPRAPDWFHERVAALAEQYPLAHATATVPHKGERLFFWCLDVSADAAPHSVLSWVSRDFREWVPGSAVMRPPEDLQPLPGESAGKAKYLAAARAAAAWNNTPLDAVVSPSPTDLPVPTFGSRRLGAGPFPSPPPSPAGDDDESTEAPGDTAAPELSPALPPLVSPPVLSHPPVQPQAVALYFLNALIESASTGDSLNDYDITQLCYALGHVCKTATRRAIIAVVDQIVNPSRFPTDRLFWEAAGSSRASFRNWRDRLLPLLAYSEAAAALVALPMES